MDWAGVVITALIQIAAASYVYGKLTQQVADHGRRLTELEASNADHERRLSHIEGRIGKDA